MKRSDVLPCALRDLLAEDRVGANSNYGTFNIRDNNVELGNKQRSRKIIAPAVIQQQNAKQMLRRHQMRHSRQFSAISLFPENVGTLAILRGDRPAMLD